MIYRKQEFVQDNSGDSDFPIKVIDHLESLDDAIVKFIGRAVLNMRTPAGIHQIPVSFEIDAESIEDAFEQYAEAAKPKIQEVRRHVQRQLDRLKSQQQPGRIITPDQAGGPDIIKFDDLKGGG